MIPKEMKTDESLILFLLEAANYFRNRDTGGEDKAHWANVINAEKCTLVAERMKVLTT